jgi:hypothetical protein
VVVVVVVVRITTTNITARLEMVVALLLENFFALFALCHEPVESSSQPRFLLLY